MNAPKPDCVEPWQTWQCVIRPSAPITYTVGEVRSNGRVRFMGHTDQEMSSEAHMLSSPDWIFVGPVKQGGGGDAQ